MLWSDWSYWIFEIEFPGDWKLERSVSNAIGLGGMEETSLGFKFNHILTLVEYHDLFCL
jgi:hypothetical protein